MNRKIFRIPLLASILSSLLILIISGCQDDEYYSVEDFQSVGKIDVHTHINTDSPALLEQAREDNFRLLTVNVDAPGYLSIVEQREIAVNLRQDYPDRLAFLTTFSLEGWNNRESWQEQTIEYLDESFSQGAIGVKVWKNIGMVFRNSENEFVMIDNAQFDPVFNHLAEIDKPLLGHIGEPKNCWLPLEEMTVNNDRNYFKEHPEYHMYKHPDYPSYETIIEARDRMLDKHPKLTFVGAHLGSMEWSVEMMADHLDRYPNMAFETAARIPHLQYLTQQNRRNVREFFIKYQDRILYATDLGMNRDSDPAEARQRAHETWIQDWKYFVTDDSLEVSEVNGSFRGLKLPKTVIDKIYGENAETWYRGL